MSAATATARDPVAEAGGRSFERRFDLVVADEFARQPLAPATTLTEPDLAHLPPRSGATSSARARSAGPARRTSASSSTPTCGASPAGADAVDLGPVQLLRPAGPPVPDEGADVRAPHACAPPLPRRGRDVPGPGRVVAEHRRPERRRDQRGGDGHAAQRHVRLGAGRARRPAARVAAGRRPVRGRHADERPAARVRHAHLQRPRRARRLLVRRPAEQQHRAFVPMRWNTPIDDYREVDGLYLSHHGTAVYAYPDGPFTYGEFTLRSIAYDVPGPTPPSR